MYTKNEIINTLTNRMNWYKKSIMMAQKEIEWENGFNFPNGNIDVWRGCYVELKNTLSMLQHNYDALNKLNTSLNYIYGN